MKNIAKTFIFLTVFVLWFTTCDTPTNNNHKTSKAGTLFVYAGTSDSLEIANDSKGYIFPDTFLNESNEVSITIKNNGDGIIKLTGKPYINLDGATAVFSVSVPPEASAVNPGGSVSFKIKFTPLNTVESYVYVSIPNDSKNLPDFSFTIYGKGMRPKPIAIILYNNTEIPQNGAINAGEVILTQPKNISVIIKNTGVEVLTLETANITITGADTAAFVKMTNPGGEVSVGEQTEFVITCIPSSLGENNAILTIPTNDNSRNPVIVFLRMTGKKGNAVLELSQSNTIITNNSLTPFDFGRVELNTSKLLVFTIKNTGNIPLELTGTPIVESSNAVFTIFVQPANRIINPGTDVSFGLYYTPTDEKEDIGTITITNNSNDMLFSFFVKGTGYVKKPQITIRQDTAVINPNGEYIFGSLPLNNTKDLTFTIVNIGEKNLNFIAVNGNCVNLENTAGNYFSVIQQPFTTTVVSPDNTAAFIIRFKPTAVGNNFIAAIQIKTDSQNNGDFYFWVKGDCSNNYKIGDTGPGGGIIFYAEGGQYKECSGELGSYTWDSAITTAQNYRGGGFNNWHLPDRGELDLMYRNLRLNNLGGFYNNSYWSSAEYSTNGSTFNTAFYYNFGNGSQNNLLKSNSFYVRAVRAFSL